MCKSKESIKWKGEEEKKKNPSISAAPERLPKRLFPFPFNKERRKKNLLILFYIIKNKNEIGMRHTERESTLFFPWPANLTAK